MIDLDEHKTIKQEKRFVPGERHGKSLPIMTIVVRCWAGFAVCTLLFLTFAALKYVDWDRMHYMITGEGSPYDVPEYIDTEPKIDIRFKDGWVGKFNFNLKFKIKPGDAHRISKVTRSLDMYITSMLIPSIRRVSRDVAVEYSIEEAFITKRYEIQSVLKKLIREEVYIDAYATLIDLELSIITDPDVVNKIDEKYGVEHGNK
jgi:hypothetical protein